MNDEQLDHFRRRLLARREELQQRQAEGDEAADTVELDQQSVGRLSRMDALQAQQMAQEAVRRRQRELMRIDAALHRLDSGDYGYCLECGDDMDTRRLEVDPSHTHCVDCASRS